LAEVTSPQGRAVLRVMVSDRVAPGHPFAPMHWTHQTAPTGRVDTLVPAVTDPVSGQPASKSAPVSIRPFAAAWYGFAVCRHDLAPDCDYWAKSRVAGGVQLELAGRSAPADWTGWAGDLFGFATPTASLSDPSRGIFRMAYLDQGIVQGALFIAREPVSLARSHVASLLGSVETNVLAGHPQADRPDAGPTICACLNVGLNTIMRALIDQQLLSVEAIGSALGAGTNCGSCRPELAALVARHARREAAE
jgi:assimilatory nitrate reductase catalytic subunit